jgi:hypothetical protein
MQRTTFRARRACDAMRSPRGWWTYLSLLLASALAAHLAFDVADSGLSSVVSRPIHLVYVLVVLAALGAAAVELYRPSGAERRRRAALVRSTLRWNGPLPLAVAIAFQALLAASTLAIEGGLLDGSRMLVAAASAIIAIVVGALALRTVHRRVLQFAAATFASREPPRPGPAAGDPIFEIVSAAEQLYYLFRPNRPPPTFA